MMIRHLRMPLKKVGQREVCLSSSFGAARRCAKSSSLDDVSHSKASIQEPSGMSAIELLQGIQAYVNFLESLVTVSINLETRDPDPLQPESAPSESSVPVSESSPSRCSLARALTHAPRTPAGQLFYTMPLGLSLPSPKTCCSLKRCFNRFMTSLSQEPKREMLCNEKPTP